MRSTRLTTVYVPIRLHLDFERMTAAELGTILQQWQAVLRAAWLERLEAYDRPMGAGFGPRQRTGHVLITTVSSRNSIEVEVAFALGEVLRTQPLSFWISHAHDVVGYIMSVMHATPFREAAADYLPRPVIPRSGEWPGAHLKMLKLKSFLLKIDIRFRIEVGTDDEDSDEDR